jgi:hypothetical protein
MEIRRNYFIKKIFYKNLIMIIIKDEMIVDIAIDMGIFMSN